MLRKILSVLTFGIIKRKRAWKLKPSRLPRSRPAQWRSKKKCVCGKHVEVGESMMIYNGPVKSWNQDGSPNYKYSYVRHTACHIKWLQEQEWHPAHAAAVSFMA